MNALYTCASLNTPRLLANNPSTAWALFIVMFIQTVSPFLNPPAAYGLHHDLLSIASASLAITEFIPTLTFSSLSIAIALLAVKTTVVLVACGT